MTWLKDNAIALLMISAGLVGVYVTVMQDITRMNLTLQERAFAVKAGKQTTMDVIQLKASSEATAKYWSRFEVLIDKNTETMTELNKSIYQLNAYTTQTERRLKALEDKVNE